MKKIISRKEYDTERAHLMCKVTHGTFGDPAGYEESLYRTDDASYFLYTNGGAKSPYTAEDIRRVTDAKAQSFLNDHLR